MTTEKPWLVYLLRCKDGSLYCGITNDLPRRVRRHNEGKGGKYTSRKRPVTVAWTENSLGKIVALQREYQIKRLSKVEKEIMVKKWKGKS